MKKIKKLLAILLFICVFAGIGYFVNDQESEKVCSSKESER